MRALCIQSIVRRSRNSGLEICPCRCSCGRCSQPVYAMHDSYGCAHPTAFIHIGASPCLLIALAHAHIHTGMLTRSHIHWNITRPKGKWEFQVDRPAYKHKKTHRNRVSAQYFQVCVAYPSGSHSRLADLSKSDRVNLVLVVYIERFIA